MTLGALLPAILATTLLADTVAAQVSACSEVDAVGSGEHDLHSVSLIQTSHTLKGFTNASLANASSENAAAKLALLANQWPAGKGVWLPTEDVDDLWCVTWKTTVRLERLRSELVGGSDTGWPSRITCNCVLLTVLVVAALGVYTIQEALWELPANTGTEGAASGGAAAGDKTRLAVLDNARCIGSFLVFYWHMVLCLQKDQETWLYGAARMLDSYFWFANPVKMPMICMLSGALSTGRGDARKMRNYFQFLVIPTVLYIFVAKPCLTMGILQLSRPQWFHMYYSNTYWTGPTYEWYLMSLIVWRGLALTLWWRMPRHMAVAAMFVISCTAGYWNLERGPMGAVGSPTHMLGNLDHAMGFLPFFAIGYGFPLKEALHISQRAYQFRIVRIGGLAAVLLLGYYFRNFPDFLPDPHGSYMMMAHTAGKDYRCLPFVDRALYFTRRVTISICYMVSTFIFFLLVLPREQTWFTWMGPYLLNVYLLQLDVLHLHDVVLNHWTPPRYTSNAAHAAVMLFYAFVTLAGMLAITSRPFRYLFKWCFEPRWLDPVFELCGRRCDSSSLHATKPEGGAGSLSSKAATNER